MPKDIKFNSEVRTLMKSGVDSLANAVKVTLGPKGRNVVIDDKYKGPHITKDGVTVAKAIELKDPFENMGAQMVKEVASKTADLAGDGTTTATVLAQAMISEGIKNLEAGANPIDLKRGIDRAVNSVISSLKVQSQSIGNDYNKIEQVGTISANNDSFIGKLIADAMQKVGNDGVITIEEAQGTETEVKVVEGMQLDRGYLSPYFATDNEKMEVILDNPYVLITDRKVSAVKELLPILEPIVKSGSSLFIIADEIDGEALSTLVVNKLKGALKVAAIKSPSFGENRLDTLIDISILTGGTVISDKLGYSLENANTTYLGQAEKVIVTKEHTTIINGKGSKNEIEQRISDLRGQIEIAQSPYQAQKLKERLGKLSGGVAVLYVGAATEVEMREKKDRIEDALCATRAAAEEGIVPGGGVAYVKASKILEHLVVSNSDEATGVNIVKKAILAPIKQIAANAGIGGDVIIYQIINKEDDFGYNARTDEFVRMFQAGIIDPLKVSRVALENAASIAGMFLTTECGIVELPE